MIASYGHPGYSAVVKMRLLVNGRVLPVAQLGPDFLYLRQAEAHAPGLATMELSVDQSHRRWEVMLPEGITPQSKRVSIRPRE